MTYTGSTRLDTTGQATAAQIQAWLCAIVFWMNPKTLPLMTTLTQTMPLVSTFCGAAFNTTLVLARPSINALVQTHVVRNREYFKILGPIVRSVAVPMMHMFTRQKGPAKHLPGNVPMLRDTTYAIRIINHHIAVIYSRCPEIVMGLFPGRNSFVSARPRTVLRFVRTILASEISLTAILAGSLNHVGRLGAHRMLLTSGVISPAVSSSAGTFHAPILPFSWGKRAA